MTAEQLAAESMLAEPTDDLGPAEAAAKYRLLQLEAWRYSNEPLDERLQGKMLDRIDDATLSAQIAGGGYIAWVVRGRSGHGVSMTATKVPEQHEIRLTRVR